MSGEKQCRVKFRSLGLEFGFELTAELLQLGINYNLAVGLLRVLLKEILVVLFGRIKLFKRYNLGDNRIGPQLGRKLGGNSLGNG